MKTSSTAKTIRPIELDLEPEIDHTDEDPQVEIEIPEPSAIHAPDTEHRKKEASKPLYLIRYE